MSDPGFPGSPVALDASLCGTDVFWTPPPAAEGEWPTPVSGDPVIAVSSTGTVTAMNVAAVSLLGPPAPHQFGLGLNQFIPARYHRVVDAWDARQSGDARAAHPDRLTLSMSAMQADGGEVWVLLTRRMLGDGPMAPYLVTMRAVASGVRLSVPPVPPYVRYWYEHPSPVVG